MLARLKQSLAIASIIAWALCIILWVRSQVWQDTIYYVPSHMSRVHRIDVMVNRAIVSYGGWTKPVFEAGLVVSSDSHTPIEGEDNFMRGFYGLKVERRFGGVTASLPYWFLTLASATAALLLNVKNVRHFGLKHAFFVMTLVAITLGLGAVATKFTTQFQWLVW